jgi:hypothetical protein
MLIAHLVLQYVDEFSQQVHVSQLHKARPQQVVQQLTQRLQQRPQRLTQRRRQRRYTVKIKGGVCVRSWTG